jgi:hypothetical protein
MKGRWIVSLDLENLNVSMATLEQGTNRGGIDYRSNALFLYPSRNTCTTSFMSSMGAGGPAVYHNTRDSQKGIICGASGYQEHV